MKLMVFLGFRGNQETIVLCGWAFYAYNISFESACFSFGSYELQLQLKQCKTNRLQYSSQ